MKTKRLTFGAILLILLPGLVYAGGPGTTGAAFLKPAQNARGAAMGGIQAIPLDGESAIFGNPAGLINAETIGFTFSYVSWFQQINFGNVSGVYPWKNFAFGAGAIYLNYGDIPGYDVNANPTGNFTAHDICGLVGAAFDPGGGLSVGGTLKVINEKIEQESAVGLGLDLGGLYRFQTLPLKLGVVVQHLGIVDMKFVKEKTPWPTLLRVGASYTLLKNTLLLVVESNTVLDDETHFSAGAEYCFMEMFSLRAGYRTGPADVGSGLCAGAGFFWRKYGLNYAFEPYGDLGNTHRFSLLIRL